MVNEQVIIGTVAGLAILVSGGIAIMAMKKKKQDQEQDPAKTTVVVARPVKYAFPLYGRPFPDPFVSRHGSKWGTGIWDHRNPYHHKH